MENLVNMLSSYSNRKVFVTGHTGFKGSWLSCLLEEMGAKQAGFSLNPYTTPSHFDLLDLKNISTIGDISDSQFLQKSIQKFEPEILFHLAAQPLVISSYKDPIATYQANVMGTLHVLEAIRSCPSIKAVVIITTDKVYENKEWVYPYRENDQLGGYDMYSSSKACAEILVRSYQRSFFSLENYKKTHNVLIATARAGNVIGGGDWSTDRLIPDIIRATIEKRSVKLRSPGAIRPWQHVLDCLYGYILLGEKLVNEEEAFAGAWNFAPFSSGAKTVHEVAMQAKEMWNDINIEFEEATEKFHEANILKLDNTKALSQLGWMPKWDADRTIRETINWYKAYYTNKEVLTHKQIQNYFK